jgi:hypothetical protein
MGRELSEVLPPEAANLAFSAIVKLPKMVFNGRQYTLERKMVRWYELQ